MTPLLCSLALLALQSDLKPLPEERQLGEMEQVALEFTRLEVSPVGMIGWTKTTVHRAQLEGVEHYLVHRVAELVEFDALAFTSMESRGLFDAEFNLVREVRLGQPLGADSKPMELEWGEDGFRWRQGRGRWNLGPDGVRPTTETDIPLFVHGLACPTPWAGQVFDDKAEELQAQTLKPGKSTTIDDEPMVTFEVEGPTPMHHLVREDGVYMESKLGELQIIGVVAEESAELGLRRALADSETFEQVVDQALPAAWSEERGTYSNSVLEMSLKLPKGWHRAAAEEVDGTSFHAYSEDSNAYVSLSATVLGTGYTLEDWGEGLLEFYSEIAVDGAVKSKEKSFAAQDAIHIEYLQDGDARFESTVYAWKRHGLGFLLIGSTLEEGPRKLHRETSSVLKSVKLPR